MGFGCTQEAASAGEDITERGGWRAWPTAARL
ncbi:hypothetical protein [Nonomuraea insulae]|uniref:Uncharacterized protein n=1 Tax=Nonomuraea insulae TaxID=1616787 RepID=A0ABW1CK51_9ACTN